MKKIYALLIIVVIAAAGGAFWWFSQSTQVEFTQSETATTATRIDKIKEIGEWEFLSISNEEVVDTTAIIKRTWPLPDSKKYLARIYCGTLRLGFDLKKDVKEGWIDEQGDTVSVTLPKIHLLDERFIDEAATRALIEDGEWTHAERQNLYYAAVRKMKRHCLTPANMQRAETSAKEQMTSLLQALGFKVINVDFDK